jgi:cytochrome c biogenesis protein CcmG/thiol:disulfide interchange protein DsbE
LTRRSRLLLAGAIVALTVVVGGWAAWSQLSAPPSIVVTGSPLLDQPAPAFRLMTLDGSQVVSLADYAGRPLIVNFWASWCIPCRTEFPLFRSARAAHAAGGLEIVGIVHNDSAAAAEQFAAGQDAGWPLLLDPDNAAWQAYKGALVPTSFYIDRQGIIRAVSFGPPPSGTLEEQLAKIL